MYEPIAFFLQNPYFRFDKTKQNNKYNKHVCICSYKAVLCLGFHFMVIYACYSGATQIHSPTR